VPAPRPADHDVRGEYPVAGHADGLAEQRLVPVRRPAGQAKPSVSGPGASRKFCTAGKIEPPSSSSGDAPSVRPRFDLSDAPSFPLPGSDLHEQLITAAAAVVRDAPLITSDQIAPAQLGLWNVPELWALSLLTQAGRTPGGDLDAARWTGLTLALIFTYTPPEGDDLRSHLLAHRATALRQPG
jgi:hypothetical protein